MILLLLFACDSIFASESKNWERIRKKRGIFRSIIRWLKPHKIVGIDLKNEYESKQADYESEYKPFESDRYTLKESSNPFKSGRDEKKDSTNPFESDSDTIKESTNPFVSNSENNEKDHNLMHRSINDNKLTSLLGKKKNRQDEDGGNFSILQKRSSCSAKRKSSKYRLKECGVSKQPGLSELTAETLAIQPFNPAYKQSNVYTNYKTPKKFLPVHSSSTQVLNHDGKAMANNSISYLQHNDAGNKICLENPGCFPFQPGVVAIELRRETEYIRMLSPYNCSVEKTPRVSGEIPEDIFVNSIVPYTFCPNANTPESGYFVNTKTLGTLDKQQGSYAALKSPENHKKYLSLPSLARRSFSFLRSSKGPNPVTQILPECAKDNKWKVTNQNRTPDTKSCACPNEYIVDDSQCDIYPYDRASKKAIQSSYNSLAPGHVSIESLDNLENSEMGLESVSLFPKYIEEPFVYFLSKNSKMNKILGEPLIPYGYYKRDHTSQISIILKTIYHHYKQKMGDVIFTFYTVMNGKFFYYSVVDESVEVLEQVICKKFQKLDKTNSYTVYKFMCDPKSDDAETHNLHLNPDHRRFERTSSFNLVDGVNLRKKIPMVETCLQNYSYCYQTNPKENICDQSEKKLDVCLAKNIEFFMCDGLIRKVKVIADNTCCVFSHDFDVSYVKKQFDLEFLVYKSNHFYFEFFTRFNCNRESQRDKSFAAGGFVEHITNLLSFYKFAYYFKDYTKQESVMESLNTAEKITSEKVIPEIARSELKNIPVLLWILHTNKFYEYELGTKEETFLKTTKTILHHLYIREIARICSKYSNLSFFAECFVKKMSNLIEQFLAIKTQKTHEYKGAYELRRLRRLGSRLNHINNKYKKMSNHTFFEIYLSYYSELQKFFRTANNDKFYGKVANSLMCASVSVFKYYENFLKKEKDFSEELLYKTSRMKNQTSFKQKEYVKIPETCMLVPPKSYFESILIDVFGAEKDQTVNVARSRRLYFEALDDLKLRCKILDDLEKSKETERRFCAKIVKQVMKFFEQIAKPKKSVRYQITEDKEKCLELLYQIAIFLSISETPTNHKHIKSNMLKTLCKMKINLPYKKDIDLRQLMLQTDKTAETAKNVHKKFTEDFKDLYGKKLADEFFSVYQINGESESYKEYNQYQ